MMKKFLSLLLMISLLAGCSSRTAVAEEQGYSGTVTESSAQDVESMPNAVDESIAPEEQAESEHEEQTSSQAPELSPSPEGSDDRWALKLVNFENGIPEDYAPELAEVQGVYKMDARVSDVAKQMINDAKAQGIELLVCSAYRPYSSQLRNFNNSVNNYVSAGYSKDKAITQTKKLIAEPGKSEHQTGLAVDIVTPSYQGLDDGYADTAAAKWLAQYAPNYGFILRYPKDKTDITQIAYEPWHFRYVGVEAAKEMTEKGLCLEEYAS